MTIDAMDEDSKPEVQTDAMETQNPSIMMLPPELRIKIFRYATVFCTNTLETGRILIHICPDGSIRWAKSGPKDYNSKINTNLMRVNKQISAEARRLCYNGNHFFFGGPKHALAFLNPQFLSPLAFESVRHVHFDITARVIVEDDPKTKCLPDWKELCRVIGTMKNPEVFIKIWDVYYYGDDDKKKLLEWNEEHDWTKPILEWRTLHSLHLFINNKLVPDSVAKRVTTTRGE